MNNVFYFNNMYNLNKEDIPITQQYLYSLVLQTVQNSNNFLSAFKNNSSRSQIQKMYEQMKKSIQNLVKNTKALIQRKLQFLEDFDIFLHEVKYLQTQNYEKIQLVVKGDINNLYSKYVNRVNRDKIADHIQQVIHQAEKTLTKAKFLLQKSDIEFYIQLHQEGVTNQTIIMMRDQNIMKKFFDSSDKLLDEIGIRKIGDKIIIKDLIEKK